jgi:hypothetical protein
MRHQTEFTSLLVVFGQQNFSVVLNGDFTQVPDPGRGF